jgi:DNA-binding winged helix-turn-helix (wHTH) protein/tetratricopeptide (TPR) repeat protein
MDTRKQRTEALAERSRFIAGDLQVHPDRLVVVRNGQDIPLEPRMMEVLVALAEKNCQVMAPSELQLAVWKTNPNDKKNPIDGENAIMRTISALRKSLGENARTARYIETLPGRGYRIKPAVIFPSGYRRLSKTAERWTHGSPFVGLAAFDVEHARVFTGRTQATAELLDAMRGQIDNGRRFVLIAGPSGCGKTSLLRAGALPLLTEEGGFGGLRALDVASCDLWAAHGGDVMSPLASALSQWTLEKRPVFAQQSIESLKDQLTNTPDTIAPTIAEAFRRCPDRGRDAQPHAHLLLLIDHAEALVARPHDPEVRSAFERALCAVCDAQRTLVAMIIRSDYAPALAQTLPLLNERKSGGGHLDVLAPKLGEIAEIIREPARQASLEFDVDAESHLLDDALRDAANGHSDALPLLQHTLQLLYERRAENGILTWAAYHDIGGLEGAIAHRAEDVFATLPADAQDALDVVLTKLIVIQSDSDAVTARHTRLDALPDTARALVDAFVAGRLFVSALNDGQPHVGVVHEALLRQWPRAVEWVEENKRLLMAKARLARAAKRWSEEGRGTDHLLNVGRPFLESEEAAQRFKEETTSVELEFLHASSQNQRLKNRIRNAGIAALVAFSISTGAISFYAWNARNEAISQRQETLALIDYMLVELTGEIRPLGDLDLLGKMGNRALTTLERRRLGEMDSHELVQYARTLGLIGERLLKTGNYSEAKKHLDLAFVAASKAVEKSPYSTDALNEKGQISYWLGDYYYRLNQLKKTLEHWKTYYKTSNEILELEKSNPKWANELGYSIHNLGAINYDLGYYDEAISFFSRSAAIKAEKKPNTNQENNLRLDYIDTLSWISRCKVNIGELNTAATEYYQQISDLRSIIETNPHADAWKRSLANALIRTADLEWTRGEHKNAERLIKEGLSLLITATEKKSENIDWTRDLAFAHMKMSDIYRSLENIREASFHIGKSSELIESLTDSHKGNIEWIRLRALIRIRQAAFSSSESIQKKLIDSSIEDLSDLYRKHPEDHSGRIALSEALLASGDYRIFIGDEAAAHNDWRRAIDLASARTASFKEPRFARVLADANERLGTDPASIEENRRWLSEIGFRPPYLWQH